MPIYEYECTQCNERSEIIKKFSDPHDTHCPKCGGEVKKLFSAPAIQFKGTGWYKTDYPSPSSKPTESKGETAKSDASESKPASEKAASEKPASEKPASEKPASEKKSESKAD